MPAWPRGSFAGRVCWLDSILIGAGNDVSSGRAVVGALVSVVIDTWPMGFGVLRGSLLARPGADGVAS